MGESIMITSWPKAVEELQSNQALDTMRLIIDIVKTVRNIRAEAGVAPNKKVSAFLMGAAERIEMLRVNVAHISILAGLENIQFLAEGENAPEKTVSAVAGGITIFLPISGLIDVKKEIERLTKELTQLEQEIGKTGERINSPSFASKAPPQVVEKEKVKLETMKEKAAKIKERLIQLQ
jgi:valyl-tRNA synthetase